jgi:hypothetical protein
VDAAHLEALLADVSLGAAVVSFGVAAYLWLTHDDAPARVAAGPAARVTLAMMPGGAMIGLVATP